MTLESPPAPLELWGGVECSLCRYGDEYSDQLVLTGHAERLEDLDLFAALGLRALRQPILWERTMTQESAGTDWSWADARLARLRELGLRPIAGLVHHGSGPPGTSVLDSAFPEALAHYAGAVAERYPWLVDFTPVNEPLTTARFSALYGHWYPHARDGLSFARALLIQCKGIVLAMRAIRAVNPSARLIQTEDLGKTHSTPRLAYQARFENDRRWLSFDLLCGRVNRDHPLWGHLLWLGIDENELAWFLEHSCPPDVIGINHYLTSERFLDERIERYPPHTHGGNGQESYADVEAVRVLAEGASGPRALLSEAWRRYRLPLAVTEVHLGCTREEQLRWFAEVWKDAQALRKRAVDVRAVTCWALLGSFDWASLLTRSDGHYEPGAFDLRSDRPRPTALAHLVRKLADGGNADHPVLAQPGWWRRPQRLVYPAVRLNARRTTRIARRSPLIRRSARPVLILGLRERLAHTFAGVCEGRSLPTRSRPGGRSLADAAHVAALLAEIRPWAVIHVPPSPEIDRAEANPASCWEENVAAAQAVARACFKQGARLLTFSSDLVFAGRAPGLRLESDSVEPLSAYGRSKAEAERLVLEAFPTALVVRTGPLLGGAQAGAAPLPTAGAGPRDFVERVVHSLVGGRSMLAVADLFVSPTFVPDLVDAALDLLVDGEEGIWHLANTGSLSWAELARRAAEIGGLDAALVEARPSWALGLRAARPKWSALGSERGSFLPPLEHCLQRHVSDCLRRFTPAFLASPAPAPDLFREVSAAHVRM